MKTVLEIVTLSTEYLQKKGVKNPRREVLDIISHNLSIRPLDLYVQFDRPLSEPELDLCRSHLQRRAKGEPIQYIRGEVEFFDCVFKVNKDVLIPRQETEILVDMAAKEIEKVPAEDKVLWDVCCGSGCIGISLKKKLPDLKVILSDLCPQALTVARENAKNNETDVVFKQGDLLSPFNGEKADFIICNPPYISEEEFSDLEIEVRDFEPKTALVAPDSGVAFYKRLAAEISTHLNPGGKVWLEIGYQQGKIVSEIFSGVKKKKSSVLQDWSGKDRFFFLEIE